MTNNLDPQPYDPSSLDYLIANSNNINATAYLLGVSPTAIAASMAREITRSDGENVISSTFHGAALINDLATFESTYEYDYSSDLKTLATNPGAFDGQVGMYDQFENPTLSDIGPGSIKILTAIQMIAQYGNTQIGAELGLNVYSTKDITAIVRDLSNPNSSLSISVAGLNILQGQNFFTGKTIAGIPWQNLTQEQQDAALTAYYTVGQHAVSVDMSENEFFPFTAGPNGGQVGPWVIFGQNYANLKAILQNTITGVSYTQAANGSSTISWVAPSSSGPVTTRISTDSSGNILDNENALTGSIGQNYSFDPSTGQYNIEGSFQNSSGTNWEWSLPTSTASASITSIQFSGVQSVSSSSNGIFTIQDSAGNVYTLTQGAGSSAYSYSFGNSSGLACCRF